MAPNATATDLTPEIQKAANEYHNYQSMLQMQIDHGMKVTTASD